MTGLSVRGLTLAEGTPARLVAEDISFSAPRGAVTAVLGGPGAGKTLLLAGIAGLRKQVRGTVLVNGVDITAAKPARRGIFLLPPGTDLGGERTVSAALRRIAGRALAGQIPELLELFGLSSQAGARLATLTHGQGYAVLAASRLLGQGDVLLVDEAGTGLDGEGRAALLGWLWRRAADGSTIVLATRTADLALTADNLVLLRRGQVLQAGAPASVYADPRDPDAARLTGPVNVLLGVVRQKVSGGFIWVAGGRKFIQLGAGPSLGGEVALYLRPEQLRLVPHDAEGNVLPAMVTRLICLGGRTKACVDTALGPLEVDTAGPTPFRTGQSVAVGWDTGAAWRPWANDDPGQGAAAAPAPPATMARVQRLPTSV
jgi:ABC-type Fe3+/spermidine/putrescine transport system ATPase subunit